MQKLIIVATLVACGLAGPIENIKESFQTVDLVRPSPINPDIPSDPKPEEKVTLITDAEEQPLGETKTVPQPAKLPGPYVPLIDSLSRSKREDKDSSESDEDSSEEDKKPSPPLRPHPSTSLLERLAARTSTTTPAPASSTDSGTPDESTSDASTSSTTTAPRKPYAPLIHQHNEHRFRPTTEAADSDGSSTSSTTTAPSVVASNDHINDKRDIPVPLTRKYHHDDEETKQKEEPDTDDAPKEEVTQEEKDEDRKPVPQAHPATISRPIPVAELFAKKPSSTE